MEKHIIYHGTSDVFLPKILKEGFQISKSENKYDEVRREFSKYVSSEVLTDDFFDKHLDRLPSGNTNVTPGLRVSQLKRGQGIFYADTPEKPQLYANWTAQNGGGEFERCVRGTLTNIPEQITSLKNEEQRAVQDTACPAFVVEEIRARQEMYAVLHNNIKPEFLDEQGAFQNRTHPHQKGIVFEIEMKDSAFAGEIDGRLNENVSLGQIKRIGYANADEKAPVSFMPVEEFLKENLKRQQSGERFSYDPAQVLADYWKAGKEQKSMDTPTKEEPVTAPAFLTNQTKDLGVPTQAPSIPKLNDSKMPSPQPVKRSFLSYFQKGRG